MEILFQFMDMNIETSYKDFIEATEENRESLVNRVAGLNVVKNNSSSFINYDRQDY